MVKTKKSFSFPFQVDATLVDLLICSEAQVPYLKVDLIIVEASPLRMAMSFQ